ncbi:hypothetical protein CENSYa_1244 [Cenarchaeum symbiosum A]|uniref:Uncharacterized protein n=1 Tax=Cenarchaeum symbiosum (strain A) TaxID=414004 RepID=A0RX00_CENSY|nr:hypothetical protein CENSYa_1244 [Cenarchaeum symbiosum A]
MNFLSSQLLDPTPFSTNSQNVHSGRGTTAMFSGKSRITAYAARDVQVDSIYRPSRVVMRLTVKFPRISHAPCVRPKALASATLEVILAIT